MREEGEGSAVPEHCERRVELPAWQGGGSGGWGALVWNRHVTKQLEVWLAWSAAVQLLCRQPLARLASAEMRWPSAQEAFTVLATRLTTQAQCCALGLAQ